MSRSKYYDKTSSQWVHSDKSGLPANVFPTFDDLRVNLNEKSLQIKASNQESVVLGDLEVGTSIYLPETINGTKAYHEYIIVLRETSNQRVTVLRKYVDTQGLNYHSTKTYFGNIGDTWCTTTFKSRFSENLQNNLVLKSIYNGNSYQSEYQDRSIFIPTWDELNSWFSDNNSRKAYVITNTGTPVVYWTRTSSGYSGENKEYTVTTSGSKSSSGSGSTTAQYYRPALVLSSLIELNTLNQYVDEPLYTDTIHSIRSGDTYYKLKDLDAREAIADLETAVAGKAAVSHTHTVSDITDFPSIPTAGTITSGSTGYATGGDVYNAINKPRYDLTFIADSDSLIDSRTTGAVVTNAYLTALVPLDELLLKSDRYDKVELCGGFHYTDPTLGFLTVVPATLSYNAIIPNQVAQQMLPTVVPGATINSKDALLVRITPVYNDNAYQGSFVIWEDENNVRQIEYVGT